MPNLQDMRIQICNLSVTILLLLCAWILTLALIKNKKNLILLVKICLPTFILALTTRLLAPWGPQMSSGRDFRYIDAALQLVDFPSHAQLISSFYLIPAQFSDSLGLFVWGQLVLGSLTCCLIAVLTYLIFRSQLAALGAGTLAAITVVLAKVDAGPSAMVTLRFTLLLALVLGQIYRKDKSPLVLAAVSFAVIALSYARLEGIWLGALVFLWLSLNPKRQNRLVVLSLLICLASYASFVHRYSLILSVPLVLYFLFRRDQWSIVSRPILLLGIFSVVIMIPRVIEVMFLERATTSKLATSLMGLLGRSHILFFDPQLCTPLAILTIVIGLMAIKKTKLEQAYYYLIAVAFPVYVTYLVFMADVTARMRFQSIGIALLMPIAGWGIKSAIEWLCHLGWNKYLAGFSMVALLLVSGYWLGFSSLTSKSTMQQEYDFILSLADKLPPGQTIYTPAANEETSFFAIPKAVQKQVGFTAVSLQHKPTSFPDLVYLGMACHRFLDGQTLPGRGHSILDQVMSKKGLEFTKFVVHFLLDKRGAFQSVIDELKIAESDVCSNMKRDYKLKPYWTTYGRGTRFDGRWTVPGPKLFGIFKADKL
jgi:hypothetical protein